jgi:hypothetical protein
MERPESTHRALRWLADLPMIAMAVGIGVLLWRTVWPRLSYPYDLEWMEGGMLIHADRVLRGESLYVLPSADFIPFIYTPFYPWLLGGLSTLGLPLDYSLGRWVSLLSVLIASLVLAIAIRKESDSIWLGVGGAALFLSTYPAAGAFFDLVRNDGLLIGVLASALLSIRLGWVRVGGLLLTAAFLTKHTAALFGLPALWWLWHHKGAISSKRFVLWSVVPALLSVFALQLRSDGLFLTYLLGVPSVHPFIGDRFLFTAPKEMFGALPWVSGVIAIVALMTRWPQREGTRFWVAQGATAIVLSAVMRGHHGGYLNVLIPGLWAVALWACLAIHYVRSRWPGVVVRTATASLVAWQLWSVQWNPGRYIPTAKDEAAGDAVVAQLKEIDGEILAPWQPWMPVQAGKKGGIALIALWDIDHEGGPLYKEAQVIEHAIEQKHWGAVLTARAELKRGLRKHYKRAPFTRPPGKTLYPKTGWRVRPHALWVPKND